MFLVTLPGGRQEVKSAGNFKVCVCGGSGGIGQPLAMLMALDPNVKEKKGSKGGKKL